MDRIAIRQTRFLNLPAFLYFARSTAIIFAAAVALAAASAQTPPPPAPTVPQQMPAIRIDVDRVNLSVVVTTADGHFVEGLTQKDFKVFDNGIEQPLTDFAAIDEPAQVLLLIESGPAVYLLEAQHVAAANALLSGLSPADRIAVVKYSQVPEALLDFTADKSAAGNAFDTMRFNLGFGSLNLSSSLSTVIDWLSKVRGKKSIVLLSTGVDTSANEDFQRVAQKLAITDVRLFAVSLIGELRNPPPPAKNKKKPEPPSAKAIFTAQQFAEADQFMRELAQANGGRVYFPMTTQDFLAIYSQIAQLVRHEYTLAYTPPARDGVVHAIEVRLATQPPVGTEYRVDHRKAYLAPLQ